jgi:FlaA1/EpsC-like NDP-sugar epimerase
MNNRFIVFGCSHIGRVIANMLKEYGSVVSFLDNDKAKQGYVVDGIPVHAPEEINEIDFDVVYIPNHSAILKAQLLSFGVEERVIITRGNINAKIDG